jgi:hypothetical protein
MSHTKNIGRAGIAIGLLTAGIWVGSMATAPEATATPCGGGMGYGNGGSQCDGPVNPDGSFERCVSVYVVGIGGWNCYTVYPAAAAQQQTS